MPHKFTSRTTPKLQCTGAYLPTHPLLRRFTQLGVSRFASVHKNSDLDKLLIHLELHYGKLFSVTKIEPTESFVIFITEKDLYFAFILTYFQALSFLFWLNVAAHLRIIGEIFESDSSLPTIAVVFKSYGWLEQIICRNNAVMCGSVQKWYLMLSTGSQLFCDILKKTKEGTQVQQADDRQPICLFFSEATFDYRSLHGLPQPWNCPSKII